MINPYNSWVKREVKSMQGCSKTAESLQTTKLAGQTMTANYSVEKLPAVLEISRRPSEPCVRIMFDPRHASENPKLPAKLKVRWSCFFFLIHSNGGFHSHGGTPNFWMVYGWKILWQIGWWLGVPPFGFLTVLATYRNWASPSLGLLPVWWLRRGARRTGHDNCWQLGWQLPFYSCLDPSFRISE